MEEIDSVKLPEGWKAGEIQWPAPKVLKDNSGGIIFVAATNRCIERDVEATEATVRTL